jgi:tripartite-type tricarboxylate transporter receptor subunit TctC
MVHAKPFLHRQMHEDYAFLIVFDARSQRETKLAKPMCRAIRAPRHTTFWKSGGSMNFVKHTTGVLLAAALASGPTLAQAQAYPTKPITILVGLAAGGTLDTIGRIYAAQIEKKWKQPAIVENRPGGGGLLAFRGLARAPADGHTIVMGASPTQVLWVKEPGYAYEDLLVASVVGVSRYGLMVSKRLNINTLGDFIKFAKANSDRINLGMIPASAHEMEVRSAQSVLGIEGAIIPYKGIADIYTALIGGVLSATMHSNSPQVQSGQVLALAMGGDKRSPDMPNVPTFKELGFDYNPGANFVLYVRAGTARPIIDKIAEESAIMIKSEEFLARVTKPYSITGLGMPYEASVRYMNDEYARMKGVVDRAGIKPQ